MKNLRLLGVLFLSSLLLATTSCVVEDDDEETPACEEQNYGSVTITNNTGEYWDFDVTYENSGTTWYTNEEVRLYDGESYTWDEIDAGQVKIWAKDGITVTEWVEVDDLTLTACENYYFTPTAKCDLFSTAEVTVVNGYSDALYVDIYAGGTWISEQYLSGYSQVTYYNVPAGSITFAAQWASGGDWNYSSEYTLNVCDEFTFTWEGKKMEEFVKGPKEAFVTVEKAVKADR